jgi:hypothetical protein
VRCAAPAAPTLGQSGGLQVTTAPVVGRPLMFDEELANGAAWLESSPRMARDAAPVSTSSTVN